MGAARGTKQAWAEAGWALASLVAACALVYGILWRAAPGADWTESTVTGTPVWQDSALALAFSLPLWLGAMLLGTVLGVAAGRAAAHRQVRAIDLTPLTLFACLPLFFVGTAVTAATGGYGLAAIAVTGLLLALPVAARVTRAFGPALAAVENEPHWETDRLLGLDGGTIAGRMTLAAARRTVEAAGAALAPLAGMAAVLEAVLGLPGIGSHAVAAASAGDAPALATAAILMAVAVTLTRVLCRYAAGQDEGAA